MSGSRQAHASASGTLSLDQLSWVALSGTVDGTAGIVQAGSPGLSLAGLILTFSANDAGLEAGGKLQALVYDILPSTTAV